MEELFSWQRFLENIPKMLPYLSVTFEIVLLGAVLGSVLGLLIAIINVKKIPVLHQVCLGYISFMRGTPMLVQLYLVLYGLPILLQPIIGGNIGREWNRIVFASITFILNEGAFLGVIFQSGLQAIAAGQMEAGYCVGLTEWQCFRRVIIPQALRVVLPPFGTDMVYLFQGTALAFTVGVVDFMGRATTIGNASGHALEAYVLVAIVYMICSLAIRLAFTKINSSLGCKVR